MTDEDIDFPEELNRIERAWDSAIAEDFREMLNGYSDEIPAAVSSDDIDVVKDALDDADLRLRSASSAEAWDALRRAARDWQLLNARLFELRNRLA